jgi:hypothetical protein
MRGDVVCLRGTVRAFAERMVKETRNGPRHVRYDPLEAERLAGLRIRGRGYVRKSDDPVGGEG